MAVQQQAYYQQQQQQQQQQQYAQQTAGKYAPYAGTHYQQQYHQQQQQQIAANAKKYAQTQQGGGNVQQGYQPQQANTSKMANGSGAPPEQRTTRFSQSLILTTQMYDTFALVAPKHAVNESEEQRSSDALTAQQRASSRRAPELPEQLKSYILRAYQKCLTSSEQLLMKNLLKNQVNMAIINKELHSKQWGLTVLPMLPREKQELKMQQELAQMRAQLEKRENSAQAAAAATQDLLKLQTSSSEMASANSAAAGITTVGELRSLAAGGGDRLAQQRQELQSQLEKQKLKNVASGGGGGAAQAAARVLKRPNPYAGGNSVQQHELEKLQKKLYQPAEEIDFERVANQCQIVGTCQQLEKPYFRITQSADPTQIRPEAVLKRALKLVREKWQSGEVDYAYMQSQFRSMRQDLVVQHIRNEFTVKVCEHNARICLENHDVMQFKQCITTLYELYKDGISGKQAEFDAYRVIHHFLERQVQQCSSIMHSIHSYDDSLIKFALEFIEAVTLGNVLKVFKLYRNAPDMIPYLIEIYLDRLRLWGLRIILKK